MLGFSLGPLIGGALTHYADWRVIFWASGVSMVAAAGGFVFTSSAAPTSGIRRVGRFDWVGFVLLAIFMSALVSALHALPAVTRAPLSLALPHWRPRRSSGCWRWSAASAILSST